MRIVGLDVGYNSVVACCLEKNPHSVKQFFNQNKHHIPKFEATRTGIEDTSGKSQRWIPGGSGHCRQALWQWCLTRIEPKANRRLQTEVGQHLGDYVDKLKIGGTPAKVAQLRCCAKAATLLFQKLARQIT